MNKKKSIESQNTYTQKVYVHKQERENWSSGLGSLLKYVYPSLNINSLKLTYEYSKTKEAE